jgi:nucleoside-diphosphate-sugar epimerase
MSKLVLVTGSSGCVGRAACKALLAAGHRVRGFDLVANAELSDQVVGTIADSELMERAVSGVDAIVHLAAAMEWLEFLRDQVPANIIAIYHLFEAAQRHHVPRIAVASTIQVARWKKDAVRRISDGTSPSNTYGATKVFAEAMGQVYAHRAKTCVIAARICWLPRNLDTVRVIREHHGQTSYLSHDDAGRFFLRAVDAEHPDLAPGTFHAMYVTSKVPPDMSERVDISEARTLLGYDPQDIFPEGLPFPI